MFNFVVYKKATGEIQSIGQCMLEDDVKIQNRGDPSLAVLIGNCDSDVSCYVHKKNIKPRPTLPSCKIPEGGWLADGESKIVWQEVPNGVKVIIDGTEVGLSDGPIELTATVAATYKIRLEPPFPYLPEEWSIEAHAV